MTDAPNVPDRKDFHPGINSWYATGTFAVTEANELPKGNIVALDIETVGLGADSFTIKCVTAAWETMAGTMAVLLDPRREDHHKAVRRLTDRAGILVLHNATFDVPPLVHHELMAVETINKITDTLVLARMAYPDTMVKKGLADLAYLVGQESTKSTMSLAFKAAGYKTQAEGYAKMDINTFAYRVGAMADTVVTYRLAGPLWSAAMAQITRKDYPDAESGAEPWVPRRILSPEDAEELISREQIVNRVMMRRSARGIKVDTTYLAAYKAEHEVAQAEQEAILREAGIDADAGNLGFLVATYLDEQGLLPDDYPRTGTGKLSATRDDLTSLPDHPLVDAQQAITEVRKVLGYLEKVEAQAAITGRCHPQVGVLGASATGRMSYSSPELQQFPADARPILVPDEGDDWVSLDFKAIEPVVAALMARDEEFLAPFEAGEDLYAPLTAAAGVDRKVAKVVLLGLLYGMGLEKLAATLGVDEKEALKLQRLVASAMKPTTQLLLLARDTAERSKLATSGAGRMLSVPSDPKTGRVFSSKASNYIVQSTALDVLSEAIVKCEAAGLGDAIHLALHDELVVSSWAAEQIQKTMETPPEWLEQWAGRTPTIRVDRNELGQSWKYV